jgi:serine/threonine protein kinase
MSSPSLPARGTSPPQLAGAGNNDVPAAKLPSAAIAHPPAALRSKHSPSVSSPLATPPTTLVPSPSAVTVPARSGGNEVPIGDYIITDVLGSGSFATVYRGHHARDVTAAVAVKVIPVEKLDSMARKALEAEVKMLRDIHHPNIVKLLDVQRSAKYIFIVLEFCAGGDLTKYIRAKGPLNETQAQRVLRQLAAGLRHLWQNHLIHRDIKPSNLLLTEGNVDAASIKLADFGFARYLETSALAETLCGSPLYMSPELLRMQPYDAKADLWSVGVLLVELLTGKTPFTGRSPLHLLHNIEKNEWANAVTHPTLAEFSSDHAHRTLGGMLNESVAEDLSSECKDLIWCLLRRNANARMGFNEFFKHPWVSLHEEDTEEEDDSSSCASPQRVHQLSSSITATTLRGTVLPAISTDMHASKAISRGLDLVAALNTPTESAQTSQKVAGRVRASTFDSSEQSVVQAAAAVTVANTSSISQSDDDDFIVIDDRALDTVAVAPDATRQATGTFPSLKEGMATVTKECLEAAAIRNHAEHATKLATARSLDAHLRAVCYLRTSVVSSKERLPHHFADECDLPFGDAQERPLPVIPPVSAGPTLSMAEFDAMVGAAAGENQQRALDLWEQARLAFRGATGTCHVVDQLQLDASTSEGFDSTRAAIREWQQWCERSAAACEEALENGRTISV